MPEHLGARDEFFSDARAASREDYHAEREANFEESIIKELLRKSGAPPNWGAAAKECFEQTDSKTLNFSWFEAAYPGFPLSLVASPLDWTHKTTMWDLFDNFHRTKIFQGFQAELAREGLNDRLVGFVFRAGRRSLILHTLHRSAAEQYVPRPGRTRVVYELANAEYILESLANLLAAIGNKWAEPA